MSGAPEIPETPAGGLPVSPLLAAELTAEFPPQRLRSIDRRIWFVCALAVLLGVVATGASQLLLALIDVVTNLAFYGRWSTAAVSPADNTLGVWLPIVPMVGGLLVGLMARYGSKAIRGHGIPEAMEQVLVNQSRIPVRVTFLKPLSAAVSIGTGGPFGAEGPIIATGGALGSLVGQIVTTTAAERKTLLAAGAAAGMTATFGTPLAAVLLAVELLLFEYRPQSLIPLALATITAALGRAAIEGHDPVFAMTAVPTAGLLATVAYVAFGALLGIVAVGVTRMIYLIEDAFERLPIHFMWWPVLGGLAVGLVGLVAPRTLGVGYQNLDGLLTHSFTWQAAAILGLCKFVSWSISLGSGTSGGTLAPLLTVGGCLGTAVAVGASALFPQLGLHVPTAALVGMAALFAGASRAPLASALFAFEATREVAVITPLLGGCIMSYLVSCRLMQHSIMTEKIARRGIKTPTEYTADALDHVLVRDVASKTPVVLQADETVDCVRGWLTSAVTGTAHQGFPVVDGRGCVLGVLTRRELLNGIDGAAPLRKILRRMPIVVYDDCSVREAVEHMMRHEVGRLPVMARTSPSRLVGIITRSDVLAVYSRGK